MAGIFAELYRREVAVLVAFAGVAAVAILYQVTLPAWATRLQGTVIALEAPDGSGTNRRLQYQFQGPDGELHLARGHEAGFLAGRLAVGDPVEVLVWPCWPYVANLATQAERWTWPRALGLLVGLLVFVPLLAGGLRLIDRWASGEADEGC